MPVNSEQPKDKEERAYARIINEQALERKVKSGATFLELVVSLLEFVVDVIAFMTGMQKRGAARQLKKLERIEARLIKKKKRDRLTPSQRKLLRRVQNAIEDIRDSQRDLQ
jgi:hypothetical protein